MQSVQLPCWVFEMAYSEVELFLKYSLSHELILDNKLQAVVWETVNMQFIGELTQMGNRLGRSMQGTSCESSEKTEKRTNAV